MRATGRRQPPCREWKTAAGAGDMILAFSKYRTSFMQMLCCQRRGSPGPRRPAAARSWGVSHGRQRGQKAAQELGSLGRLPSSELSYDGGTGCQQVPRWMLGHPPGSSVRNDHYSIMAECPAVPHNESILMQEENQPSLPGLPEGACMMQGLKAYR
jgi:hypothetical protein